MSDNATVEYARTVLSKIGAPERETVQRLLGRIASLEAEAGVLDGERKALKAKANEISRQLSDAHEELQAVLPANPLGQQLIG